MPVAVTDLIGLSIDDVLDIEARAVTALKAGGSVVSWSGAGSSVQRIADGSPADILRAVNYAKKHLQPEIYGRNVTRTSVSFYKEAE